MPAPSTLVLFTLAIIFLAHYHPLVDASSNEPHHPLQMRSGHTNGRRCCPTKRSNKLVKAGAYGLCALGGGVVGHLATKYSSTLKKKLTKMVKFFKVKYGRKPKNRQELLEFACNGTTEADTMLTTVVNSSDEVPDIVDETKDTFFRSTRKNQLKISSSKPLFAMTDVNVIQSINDQASSAWIWIGTAIGAVVLMGILGAVGVYCYKKKKGVAKGKKDSISEIKYPSTASIKLSSGDDDEDNSGGKS